MISINREAMKIVRRILEAPAALGVLVERLPCGATVIDMGQAAPGGWVAGKLYTRVTLGGLGSVSYEPFAVGDRMLSAVRVMIDHPLEACVASQIAGWRLEGARSGAPILAGPARALNHGNLDHYFDLIDYRDQADEGVIAIQTAEPVTDDWATVIALRPTPAWSVRSRWWRASWSRRCIAWPRRGLPSTLCAMPTALA
jgi:methenyltetrahydromethanopterin cyclohydrolase